MIELQNISKTYQMGKVEVRALSGVSVKIRPGEFVAIMGPSVRENPRSCISWVFWTVLMFFVALSVGLVTEETRRERRRSARLVRERTLLEERQRMARDLHDTSLKTLHGLALEAHALRRQLTSPEAAKKADYIESVCHLATGDVHACMGDGEISITALEIPAEVRVRVDLRKRERIARPWIEFPDRWITTGDGPEAADAIRTAAEEMARLLMRRLALSADEAYMLLSIRGDARVSQCAEPTMFPATARMIMPRLTGR